MSLTPPFIFNVEVKAESGKQFEANIIGVTDSASGATMKNGPADLSAAYDEVAKFTTANPVRVVGGSSSQSSRGGRSRKGKRSKGGKSRKGRKSLRRK